MTDRTATAALTVADWMTPDPVAVAPEAGLIEIRALFRRHRFHHVPVVADGRPVGVVSDRDVLAAVSPFLDTPGETPRDVGTLARTAADLFYLDEIASLGAKIADFSFTACLSESMADVGDGVHVVEGNVTDIVKGCEPDLARTEVYFCGPPPMVDAALALAETAGVPRDQIFYDKFTSPAFD